MLDLATALYVASSRRARPRAIDRYIDYFGDAPARPPTPAERVPGMRFARGARHQTWRRHARMTLWMDFNDYFLMETAVSDRLDELRRTPDPEAAPLQ